MGKTIAEVTTTKINHATAIIRDMGGIMDGKALPMSISIRGRKKKVQIIDCKSGCADKNFY